MGSRLRFFGAGVAVSALCILLASMTWLYVLGLFVLAGIGWGLWSWLSELEKERERARAERAERKASMGRPGTKEIPEPAEAVEPVEPPAIRKRRFPQISGSQRTSNRAGNVYQFPLSKQMDAEQTGRSEAAD